MSTAKDFFKSLLISIIFSLGIANVSGGDDPGTTEPDPDPLQSPTVKTAPYQPRG